jgi:hypothetical protein
MDIIFHSVVTRNSLLHARDLNWFFCRMLSSEMLRRVALVRTDVSEEPSASFIRVTKIGELRTTNTKYFFAACVSC